MHKHLADDSELPGLRKASIDIPSSPGIELPKTEGAYTLRLNSRALGWKERQWRTHLAVN